MSTFVIEHDLCALVDLVQMHFSKKAFKGQQGNEHLHPPLFDVRTWYDCFDFDIQKFRKREKKKEAMVKDVITTDVISVYNHINT